MSTVRGASVGKLSEVRRSQMLTQRDLSERSGIPQATISRLESDPERRANFATVRKLAEALGVSPGELTNA